MGAQEERFVQVGWHVEHEAQEEGCCTCTQGCEPLHQGAVRVQGQASLQDREVLCHEEVEGVAQLSRMTSLMWSWMHRLAETSSGRSRLLFLMLNVQAQATNWQLSSHPSPS